MMPSLRSCAPGVGSDFLKLLTNASVQTRSIEKAQVSYSRPRPSEPGLDECRSPFVICL